MEEWNDGRKTYLSQSSQRSQREEKIFSGPPWTGKPTLMTIGG